jgi:membrane-associated phospholipid phosphatase
MSDRQVFIRERLRALAGAFLVIGLLGAAAALVVGDGESVTRVHFSNWVQRNYSLLRTVTNAGLYPFYFLFIGLFLYGHWRGERAYKLLAQGYLIAQLLGGVLLVRILKMTLGRARPDASPLPGFESDWIGFTWDAKFHSFPSGHSADIVTSAIFAALLFRSPWAAALCVAWAVSLGLTRLAVAKHYPSDALAGAAIALVMSLLVVRYWLLPRLASVRPAAV